MISSAQQLKFATKLDEFVRFVSYFIDREPNAIYWHFSRSSLIFQPLFQFVNTTDAEELIFVELAIQRVDVLEKVLCLGLNVDVIVQSASGVSFYSPFLLAMTL